jgi:hypothetical protein
VTPSQVAAHRSATPPAAGRPVTAPPDLQPARMAGPEPRPQDLSGPQYAQWERYGAPQ